MKKWTLGILGLIGFLFGAIGYADTPVDDDSNIEIASKKYGAPSAEQQAVKSKELLNKYDRAKQHAAQSFGLAPKESQEPKPENKPISKEDARKPSQKNNITVYLKNGQSLAGVIREKDEKGMWIDAGDGATVYVTHEEVLRITTNAKS